MEKEKMEALMRRMEAELPKLREDLRVSAGELAEKTGIERERLKKIEAGTERLTWSGFMSILFVLWSNDTGRELIEKKGLFPKELKEAMSVNRSAHKPTADRVR